MSSSLDEGYFQWLYSQFANPNARTPRRSHWSLAKLLYSIPFRWSIRNDDNREADGQELRFEYLDVAGETDYDFVWMSMECSILEMLIALSRRASDDTDMKPSEWFWIFLDNLDISGWNDYRYDEEAKDEIEHIVNRLISRTYDSDGRGGLFPLRHPQMDQRRVELWYQLSAYLLEQETVGVHH